MECYEIQSVMERSCFSFSLLGRPTIAQSGWVITLSAASRTLLFGRHGRRWDKIRSGGRYALLECRRSFPIHFKFFRSRIEASLFHSCCKRLVALKTDEDFSGEKLWQSHEASPPVLALQSAGDNQNLTQSVQLKFHLPGCRIMGELAAAAPRR